MIREFRTRNWPVVLLLLVFGCAGCASSSATATQAEAKEGMTREPSQLTPVVPTDEDPSSAGPTLPPPTSSVAAGHIEMPWGIADAGNWFLYATSTLTLTWIDAPAGCEQYEFLLIPSSAERIVIGTDLDPSDGISVDWQVPEGLSEAGLRGEALCSGSQIGPSLHSGILYSGDSPPEGVCVLASANIGAPDVLREPSPSSEVVAKLRPGDFAPVLEHNLDGWYRIGTDTLTPIGASESSPDTGWITDQYPLKFFGPCDDIPVTDK